MKMTLFFSSILILIIACNADLLSRPVISDRIKKFGFDMGIIKTAPPNVNNQNRLHSNSTPTARPLAETIYNHPGSSNSSNTSYKPSGAFNKNTTSSSKGHNAGQGHAFDKIQTATKDKNIGSTGKFDGSQKPETSLNKSSPGTSFPKKNGVTSFGKDGTVTFPDENHEPDSAPVGISIVCETNKAYPPEHPCLKMTVKVVCADGSSLDETNKCRPNDL